MPDPRPPDQFEGDNKLSTIVNLLMQRGRTKSNFIRCYMLDALVYITPMIETCFRPSRDLRVEFL